LLKPFGNIGLSVAEKGLEENPIKAIVLGEGPSHADVMLIGQNPGKEEVKQGKPFVGRSGKYLDTILVKNNIERSKLYITSVVKHSTPGNRRPEEREIRHWMPYLIDEIKRVKPKIILLMGEVAWRTPRFEGIKYIETYHPAAAMRFPKARERFEKDFQELGSWFTASKV
jgi:uracil-DNA glycosylase